jgi:hypothetical protein
MWNNIAGSGSTSEDADWLRLLNFGLANLFGDGCLLGTWLLAEFLCNGPLLFRGDHVRLDCLEFAHFFLHLLLSLSNNRWIVHVSSVLLLIGLWLSRKQLFLLFTVVCPTTKRGLNRSLVLLHFFRIAARLRLRTVFRITRVLLLPLVIQNVDVVYSRMSLNLPHPLKLKLLSSCGVCLVHLMLDLPHTFGLLDSELFAFLVPSPLVDLPFTQASLFAQR